MTATNLTQTPSQISPFFLRKGKLPSISKKSGAKKASSDWGYQRRRGHRRRRRRGNPRRELPSPSSRGPPGWHWSTLASSLPRFFHHHLQSPPPPPWLLAQIVNGRSRGDHRDAEPDRRSVRFGNGTGLIHLEVQICGPGFALYSIRIVKTEDGWNWKYE